MVLVAGMAVVLSPADVALRLRPRLPGDPAAGRPGVQVPLLEVDPTIAAGEAGPVWGPGESFPPKRQFSGPDGARLELPATRGERDRSPATSGFGKTILAFRPRR